jgi:hypothetical protein
MERINNTQCTGFASMNFSERCRTIASAARPLECRREYPQAIKQNKDQRKRPHHAMRVHSAMPWHRPLRSLHAQLLHESWIET